MGNTPSTEETAKKLSRDTRALTLPVGSKVEQLFYEDFDPSASSTTSSSSDTQKPTKTSSKQKKRFSSIHPTSSSSHAQWQDKWTPIPVPTAQTGFSDPAHLSKQQQFQRPLHNIPDKPLPSGPPIGPGVDFFLSPSPNANDPLTPPSRSSSKGKEKEPSSAPPSIKEKHDSGTATAPVESSEAKPKVSNETTPSSSTYSAAESRWQERISKRIADRKVSDGVKAGLSQTAYMGTENLEVKDEEQRSA